MRNACALFVVMLLTADSSDWGAAPRSSFRTITSIEIRNDTSVDRAGEVAYSGIPVARSADLKDVADLAIISRDGRRIPAQFSALSRWGGTPDDPSLPIRWLQVTLAASVAAGSTAIYELRRYDALSPQADLNDVRVTRSGGVYTVHTGSATFELDPTLPSLLRSITRRGVLIYRHTPEAGPRVVDAAGATLAPRVDANTFVWEASGPVQAVARLRGHFARGTVSCGHDLGYDVRFTFERGSSDIGVQYHVVNECGNGLTPAGRLPDGAPWWNKVYRVSEVSWNFPVALAPERQVAAGGSGDIVHRRAGIGDLGLVLAEQEPGRPGAVYRQARLTRDGVPLEAAEEFEKPFVAVADANVTAIIQLPWMRYREPQAVAALNNVLSLRVISRPFTIGEAQGIWSFGRLAILDGDRSSRELQEATDRGQVALERGLLVHVPIAYLDSTDVMPPLTPASGASARPRYLAALEKVHDDTVRHDGQWHRQKIYGIALWPDYPADGEREPVDRPSRTQPGSNYWSATAAEFRQWFVDGDPKWVWDFALPQEYTQLFTNYYNLGSRNNLEAGNYRGGFTVLAGSGGAEGEVFRSGWGSDDYTYNQGSDEAYLIRPNGAVRERFAEAADTFIRRYGRTDIPPAEQRLRDRDLRALTISRSNAERVNALSYAAQFSSFSPHDYVRTLTSVMNEYAIDNLKGGIFCEADFGNDEACVGARGIYHFVGLQLGTFLDYLYAVGPDDRRGAAIKRAIVTTAGQYYRVLMNASLDGSIDPRGDWFGALDCTFRDGGATLVGCTGKRTQEPVYSHERAGALAFLLIAHHLSPNQPMCAAAARALPGALAAGLDYLNAGAGWNKGAAQSMHHIAHGLAIASDCR